MKKMLITGIFALLAAMGPGTDAMQPALGNQSETVVEAMASRDRIEVKYPVWKGGTPLARAKVNSAIEAELYSFYTHLPEDNEFGPTQGYATWQAGLQKDGVHSYILLESTMMSRAAHPSHHIVGLNFREDGSKITYAQILKILPHQTKEEIQAIIARQAEEQGLSLFPDALETITQWPKDFYIGEDRGIYFIFQHYDIAPYAAGWIAIKAGEWK